jgi:hypothetical protein
MLNRAVNVLGEAGATREESADLPCRMRSVDNLKL